MGAATIEHRPKSTDEEAAVSHFVIVTSGAETHGSFKTQHEAKDKACAEGYRQPSTSLASATCRTATTRIISGKTLAEV